MPSNPDAGKHCGPCLLGSHYSDHACMAFGWEEPASSLISQFKYRHRLQNGKVLATLLAERIRNTYQDVPLPQLLVPVPLHGSRLRARGYNQSVLIARELKRQLAIPVCMNLVKRVRPTIPQQGLSARERKQNLRGAFAFDQKTLARMPAVTSVAIIDDVVTTMTTADSVARLLRSCMPEPLEIHLWALARA